MAKAFTEHFDNREELASVGIDAWCPETFLNSMLVVAIEDMLKTIPENMMGSLFEKLHTDAELVVTSLRSDFDVFNMDKLIGDAPRLLQTSLVVD